MSIEVAFHGVLARDAERKTSKNDKAYLKGSVRVEAGEKVQHVSVLIFDQDAIAVADKFVAGARVYCEGRLSLDEWIMATGEKRTGLSCMSFHCRLSAIGRNKPDKPKQQDFPRDMHAPLGNTAADLDDDIPF